ncbi:hypothetical protein [Streptomyces sp. NPDC006134]|uniref:hypothetical protein n=1 Tax=Streptomyces sp. NPDC006134 TaxID=3154467 RepID=UPI0033D07D0F
MSRPAARACEAGGRRAGGVRAAGRDAAGGASGLGESLAGAPATRVHPTRRRNVRTGRVLPLPAVYGPEGRHGGEGPEITHDALLHFAAEGRERRSSFRFVLPEPVRRKVLEHRAGRSPGTPRNPVVDGDSRGGRSAVFGPDLSVSRCCLTFPSNRAPPPWNGTVNG